MVARIGLIVHRTDAEREYADDRESHIGKLERTGRSAGARVLASIKDDRKTDLPPKKVPK